MQEAPLSSHAALLTEPFVIDQWVIQPGLNRISGAGHTHQVEPKVMAVLCCLAARPQQVVSRTHLMQTVWADTEVVDAVPTRCVSELRKIFGDDPRQPRVIETILKTGYRLMLPISRERPVEAARSQGHANPTGWRWAIAFVVLALIGLAAYQGIRPASSALTRLHPVPLTSLPGAEREATLSPDGVHLAFAWPAPAKDGQSTDIYVKMVGTEAPQRLTNHPAPERAPAWSPDGHRLAFMRYLPDGACKIYVVPAIGGPERYLAECGQNEEADLTWSPDGSWLAFSDAVSPKGPQGIVLYGLDTQERRALTVPQNTTYGDYDPSFSPDGRHVAFTRSLFEEARDLFMIPTEGGPAQRITADNRLISGHTWTPEGTELVYASNRTGRFELWKIPLGGSTPTPLAVGIENPLHPHIARYRNRLVFARSLNETNLWHIARGTGGSEQALPQVLIASTHLDLNPSFSPDGERLAFVSNRSGFFEVWVAQRDGSDPIQMTRFNGPLVGNPRWSPDGRTLAFDARPEGHVDLHVLEVETGVMRRLTATPSDEGTPSWSHDGRWLYFNSDRTGSWQIWKMPVEGGGAIQVTQKGGIIAFESHEGTHLYFSRQDQAGIWQKSTAGGPAAVVVQDIDVVDWGNWAVSPEGLYFVQRAASHQVLAFFDFQTKAITPVAQTRSSSKWSLPWSQPGLTVSPDGQRFVYTQYDRIEQDIMLVDGF